MVRSQARPFHRLRLLDLDDQLSAPEDVLGVRRQSGPRRLIGRVRKARPFPGAWLHHHLVAMGDQFTDGSGAQPHAVLVRLDFTGNPDPHGALSSCPPGVSAGEG